MNGCFLASVHAGPVDKRIGIVYKKQGKACGDRNIGTVRKRRKHPEDNQNNIICRIGEGKIRAPFTGQVISFSLREAIFTSEWLPLCGFFSHETSAKADIGAVIPR